MIIYETTKKEFLENIKNQTLTDLLEEAYKEKIGKPQYPLTNSWNNSLNYMYLVLEDERIPEDCGISLEYIIPNIDHKYRVDFVITGLDKKQKETMILIELKQWSSVKQPSSKIGYIYTNGSGEKSENVHPSYQVWAYTQKLKECNKELEKINTYPCVFLHNYKKQENDIMEQNYQKYIERAPIFYKKDLEKLADFIADKICYGDNKRVFHKIENSEITLSKILQYNIPDIIKNSDFAILIDEQQLVYETAIKMAEQSKKDNKKRVLIVRGGAGTGKTIIALKILVDLLTKSELNFKEVEYICPVSAVMDLCIYKLKNTLEYKTYTKKFTNAGKYTECINNIKDVLIVDEARRLKEKSGSRFKQKGENQVKEIIVEGKFSIFLVDDLQKITLQDIGTVEEIRKQAETLGAEIKELKLTSQFRCTGSSAYIQWLENTLQIANTETIDEKFDYDIQVVDTPQEVVRIINNKNNSSKVPNASRVVAGYCWDSLEANRADPNFYDVKIPEHNFEMSWNLINTKTWAVDENSIDQIGCIYRCHGLDFEYVGVIIGNDIKYKDGKIITDVYERAKTDHSLQGIKTLMKKDYEEAYKKADEVIKCTYRTLMTRGQKGCIVFCQDKALGEYLKKEIEKNKKNSHKSHKDKVKYKRTKRR